MRVMITGDEWVGDVGWAVAMRRAIQELRQAVEIYRERDLFALAEAAQIAANDLEQTYLQWGGTPLREAGK